MSEHLAELINLQHDGISILSFKPPYEEELAEEIDTEIRQVEVIASSLHEMSLTAMDSKHLEHHDFYSEGSLDALQDPLKDVIFTPDLIVRTKKQIVNNALDVICKRVNCQSAAIFLFSKDGRLERFGIRGWDKSGNEVDNDWFQEEGYDQDSFTGSAAKPQYRGYGKIKYSGDLAKEHLNQLSYTRYEKKFGELKSAIAIPLNGRNKTYGVLRIINKVEANRKFFSDEQLSMSDVTELLYLSTYISMALSNFRRDVQSQIFKYLSRLLIGYSNGYGSNREELFQQIVDLLVYNPETPFKAAILRERSNDNDRRFFHLRASSFFKDVITDGRNNDPKNLQEAPIWEVVSKGKRLIIQDLQNSSLLNQFKNKSWVQSNRFPSFGCFPLVEKGDVVGSLSVYIGYNYKFYPDSIAFLQSIANLLALFIFKIKQEDNQRELEHLVTTNALRDSVQPRESLFVDEDMMLTFRQLADAWEKETASFTVLLDRMTHPTYQRIIGLGDRVVPILLKELERQPNHWFWALEAITRQSPVKQENSGRISEMVKDWVHWGKEQGCYVSEHL
jgi:GAF domain-containing protein